jgi:putative peptidoglycan lipid II flippase
MLVMGVTLWFTGGDAADWLRWSLTERLQRLAVIVILGAAVYFATLWATGFRLRDFKRRAAE